MRPDVSEWMDGDPITTEQVRVLYEILGGNVTEEALEGFLIVCSRLVDEFGGHRTEDLAKIFMTESGPGKKILRTSLEHVCRWVKGLRGYISDYPVTIIPARPAFPLFKIINIHRLADRVYRVYDSRSEVRGKGALVRDFIMRTGKLPSVPKQIRPVRRSKPKFHWCSYECWPSPDETAKALQILPKWSNCKLRATLPTYDLRYSAYVAFSGDELDPSDKNLHFYKYFMELLTQDHPELPGGGLQIGVEGNPVVDALEEWDDSARKWKQIWTKPGC